MLHCVKNWPSVRFPDQRDMTGQFALKIHLNFWHYPHPPKQFHEFYTDRKKEIQIVVLCAERESHSYPSGARDYARLKVDREQTIRAGVL
jgi:hypothetical protein